MLTIFYDGQCPLCRAEMTQLKRLDNNHLLTFEDIHHQSFSQRFPHIDPIQADQFLHGQLANGDIIKGLDVTCMAWKAMNKHKWLQILRWPVIRYFADYGYRCFARYRHSISYLMTGKKRCAPCHKNDPLS